jgi:hypothetical protein
MNLKFLLGFLLVALLLDGPFFMVATSAVRRWGAPWRVGAGVCFGLVLVALSWLGWDMLKPSADPTSHNLWPFDLFVINVAGLLLLAILYVSRLAVTRIAQGRQPPN